MGFFSLFSLIYSILIIMAGGAVTLIVAEVLSSLYIPRYFEKKNFTENHWAMITSLTFKGYQSGELSESAMALGVVPTPPTNAELAIAGFNAKQRSGNRVNVSDKGFDVAARGAQNNKAAAARGGVITYIDDL